MDGKGRIIVEVLGAILIAFMSHFLTTATATKPIAGIENRVAVIETKQAAADERLDRIELKLDILLQRP